MTKTAGKEFWTVEADDRIAKERKKEKETEREA